MPENMNAHPPAALFLKQPHALAPNWQDFVRAVNGRFPIALYDPSKPFVEQVQGVLVVIDDGGSQGTRAMIDASKAAGVKLWHVTTNGLDHIDVEYFVEKGMPLAHAAGPQSAIALAEHALLIILYFAKNLHLNHAAQWHERVLNNELAGRVVGLIGLGASGRELAKRAACLGMRVRAVDLIPASEAALRELNVEWFGDPRQLQDLAAASDFLSIHVPNTPKTRHMVNREIFNAMKSSAVLINVARGEIIDEAALIEALQQGRIKGAGIDVYEHEPPAVNHPLLNMPNVVATPHVAGATDATFRRRVQAAAENVARVLRGEAPKDLVQAVE
ncbi:MAG TPA: NAD(P)-dependent oxidoreductase [Anaerolineae bacterium]|nr:NAD(P)-dependent oxidoreductase [Anaerolineae bacterium]